MYDLTRRIFPTVIPVTAGILGRARRLMDEHPDIMARDALHAAVVMDERLDGVFSFDADFDRIPGVVRRLPGGGLVEYDVIHEVHRHSEPVLQLPGQLPEGHRILGFVGKGGHVQVALRSCIAGGVAPEDPDRREGGDLLPEEGHDAPSPRSRPLQHPPDLRIQVLLRHWPALHGQTGPMVQRRAAIGPRDGNIDAASEEFAHDIDHTRLGG